MRLKCYYYFCDITGTYSTNIEDFKIIKLFSGRYLDGDSYENDFDVIHIHKSIYEGKLEFLYDINPKELEESIKKNDYTTQDKIYKKIIDIKIKLREKTSYFHKDTIEYKAFHSKEAKYDGILK